MPRLASVGGMDRNRAEGAEWAGIVRTAFGTSCRATAASLSGTKTPAVQRDRLGLVRGQHPLGGFFTCVDVPRFSDGRDDLTKACFHAGMAEPVLAEPRLGVVACHPRVADRQVPFADDL